MSSDRPGKPDRTIAIGGANLKHVGAPGTEHENVQKLCCIGFQVQHFLAAFVHLGIILRAFFVEFVEDGANAGVLHGDSRFQMYAERNFCRPCVLLCVFAPESKSDEGRNRPADLLLRYFTSSDKLISPSCISPWQLWQTRIHFFSSSSILRHDHAPVI